MTKYSIKNICLGIGIGLIIASIANISAAPNSLSVEDIRREAAKHNLIIMDAKALIQKQPENDNQGSKAEQQSQAQQETPKQNEAAMVVINSGTSSEAIAELLLSNKLIDSKQEFLRRLTELKKENKIQIGSFKIPKGSSVDSIIELITTNPR